MVDVAYVDLHCHLELFPDPRELAVTCAADNVRVLAVTSSPRSWRKFLALIDGINGIRPALGLHPQLGQTQEQDLPLFERLLEEARYIGEVGLDGSRAHAQRIPEQSVILRRVLRMASEQGGKVLSLHSVRAARELIDLLESDFDFSRGRAVLHWFTGSKELCARAVQLGCYFSVNAQMLRSESGRAIAREIPAARLLTETDGPFVLEHGRPATPLGIPAILKTLAAVRSVTVESLASAVTDNLRALVTERPD